ncbi:MAG: xanthine dehydrogenase accessory protein XdhC [Burkholderiaceae bacterium]
MDNTAEFQRLLASEDAVVVSISSTQGSAPREAGTWMAVFASQIVGTIGGGHVEFEAISEARALLNGSDTSSPSFPRRRESTANVFEKRYVLGPSLGQCCGGVMTLNYEKYSTLGNKYAGYSQKSPLNSAFNPISVLKAQTQRQNVALFGGGHVGKAIVHILSTLPMQVMWIDSRDEIFPNELPSNVVCEHSDPVQSAVNDLAVIPGGSHVLIMSFSHAEDLDIVASCLLRQRERADLPFIGLIGSKTKWATFRHRLEDRGFSEAELAHITCPIGVEGIKGKEPEVIAVAVAAQLLVLRN